MEIILKEDVTGLGYKNDIVNVKPGYGRNYLIPKGLGVMATVSAKKVLAENLRQQAQKLAKIKAQAEQVAKGIEGLKLVIPARVSAEGTTYGSVGAAQIAEELKKKGFDIDRKLVVVKDIKTLGHHTAAVRLHKEVSVDIDVEVVRDADSDPVEEPKKTKETPAAAPAPEPDEPIEDAYEPTDEDEEDAEETPEA